MSSLDAADDDEDWLKLTPNSATEAAAAVDAAKKRKRKLINLDDLLLEKEHARKGNKNKNNSKKKKTAPLNATKKSYLYNSSSDDERAEKAPKLLQELERSVHNEFEDEVVAEWGQSVFGVQRQPPPLAEDGGGKLLRQALQKVNGTGKKASLELLASSGFIRSWALCCGRCDESTLKWAYHEMVYSKEEAVERAACKILCDLVTKSTMGGSPFKLDWLPTLADFKETLDVYGYMEKGCHDDGSSPVESIEEQGPPKNLRSLLEFVIACFETKMPQHRDTQGDVESLLVIMVRLTLERRILAITHLVHESIMVLIRYFSYEEWQISCPRVVATISKLTMELHDGVHLIGALGGTGTRVLHLQQQLALHELMKTTRQTTKVISNPREVSKLFDSVNVKAKVVHFSKVYYQVLLADVYLWCNQDYCDDFALKKWVFFLKACSRQIFIGDERPFATKLRNRASFLVQKYEQGGFEKVSPEEEVGDVEVDEQFKKNLATSFTCQTCTENLASSGVLQLDPPF